MNILNATSNLKLRSGIAHFGPFNSYSVDGKDVELFKMEHCDFCATRLKGANSVIIKKARKFVLEYLEGSKLMEAPEYLDEVDYDCFGNCVCPSCYEEGEVNKRMLRAEAGV